MNVAILGASNKPERYSYMALKRLQSHGHTVFPVHPAFQEIEGVKVYPDLDALPRDIDTLTLYVGPEISSKLAEKIIRLNPRRVICNPGAENAPLANSLREKGIQVDEACTLVLLGTNQF